MFSSIFLTGPNKIQIKSSILCKCQGFKMVLKNLQFICRSINNLKQNGQKQFKKKSLTTFFVSREEGLLRGRILIGGFAVFRLVVVLLITKFYTHDLTISDICNFLVLNSNSTFSFGILICNFFLFKVKNAWICVLTLLSSYYCYL